MMKVLNRKVNGKGKKWKKLEKLPGISPNGWQNLSLFRQDFMVPFPDRYCVSYLVEPLY